MIQLITLTRVRSTATIEVNPERVAFMQPSDAGTVICFGGDTVQVAESLAAIKALIAGSPAASPAAPDAAAPDAAPPKATKAKAR